MDEEVETPVTIMTSVGNACLVLDWDEESYYVERGPYATTEDLREIDYLLERFELEMMEHDECPIEEHPDGTVRIWCALIGGGA